MQTSTATAVNSSPRTAAWLRVTKSAVLTPPALAALAYAVILLFVWARFAATTGMGWETYFTIQSEDSQSWRNFLYAPDPMRIHNAQAFELAYRLGALLGMRGSFFGYELMYAALWWTRSVLVFLLLRRLVPGSTILPFIAGAILMVHAPDVLFGWLGQIHQFGYFVWLLIALHLLLSSLQSRHVKRTAIHATLFCVALYFCLWTYEGPLFIVAAAPPVFAFLIWPVGRRRLAAVAAVWYMPVAVYVYQTFQKYLVLSAGGYQQSLVRHSFNPMEIVGDWIYVVQYSLSFWAWVPTPGDLRTSQIAVMAVGVVAVFILGGLAIHRYADTDTLSRTEVGRLWRVLTAGAVFLILSFPAHLMLAAARSPRRTQLLSGIAASMVLATLSCLLATAFPKARFRPIAALLIAVPIVFAGSWRTIERQANHRAEWNVHWPMMQRLLRAVPRLRENTVVVMTNVPKSQDPFYNSHFWFDNALRLAYPRTVVAGIYYYDDGSPGPGMNLELKEREWSFTGEGVVPVITKADVGQTLVLRDDPAGLQILPEIPASVCSGPCVRQPYDPGARVLAGPPAIEAVHRYGGT